MKILQNQTMSMSRTRSLGNFFTEHRNFLLIAAICMAIGIDPTEALASSTTATAFDLKKAVGGMFNPVIETIDDHWGKALLAMGAVGMIVAPGDLKTKAVGSGMGVALGGIIMGGIKLFTGVS